MGHFADDELFRVPRSGADAPPRTPRVLVRKGNWWSERAATNSRTRRSPAGRRGIPSRPIGVHRIVLASGDQLPAPDVWRLRGRTQPPRAPTPAETPPRMPAKARVVPISAPARSDAPPPSAVPAPATSVQPQPGARPGVARSP